MDIYDLSVSTLVAVAYAQIVEDAGPLTDRAEVREHLDKTLHRISSQKKSKGMRRGGMSASQAKRIAADLSDYDAKAAKGRIEA